MSTAPPLIAHVIYRLDIGGLENGLVNLINRIPEERYRHAIVCLTTSSDFAKRISRTGVEIVALHKKPGKDLGCYWRFASTLRRMKPAIVHTRNLGTVDLQWLAMLAGVKYRCHGEHGWEASDPTGDNPKNLRIRRACSRVIRRYSAVSRNLAQWLTEKVGVTESRIKQIYNGVDSERFTPQGSLPHDLPWLNLTESNRRPFVFGTVGRLDPIKNQLELLDAFASVLQASTGLGVDLRLTIAGAGPMEGQLKARIAELNLKDRVWMPGARNDVAALLRSFDVFMLPSLNEGISNTILEAMSTGKPVIAGRVGGNRELVDDRVTGWLYEPNSPGALQEAMLAYLRKRDTVGLQGAEARRRVLARYSLDAMTQGYLDFYDQLMTET